MMQTSEQIAEIAAACAKAQAELENIAKSGTNPHFNRSYGTLPDALTEIRAKYAKHGVAIWQFPINGEGSNIGVVTRFAHSSGQWIESTLYVAPSKFDAQGAGSVITYLRRYALMAMAAVSADDDDDASAAVARPEQRARSNGHTASPTLAAPAANGKDATSTAQSRGPSATGSAAEPPVNPDTGEVSPHKIALPQANGTGLPDWLGFGRIIIAAFKSASTIGELAEWEFANIDAINEMASKAPKAHASVTGALKANRDRLGPPEPDMLGADETQGVLIP